MTEPASSAAALSSSSSPALLSPAALSVAAGLVERTVTAEQRRQKWWWFSLALQAVIGFLLANGPNVAGLVALAMVFVANMLLHVATGIVTRLRLRLDAHKEVLDEAGLLEAVQLVRRGKRLAVEDAVERVDHHRRLRAR